MARKLVVEIVGDASSLQRSLRRSGDDAKHFDRSLNQSFRGIAAGSGALKSLGRSLAFAGTGFITAAAATDLLRGSIEQATQRVAAEKSLAAQFLASGLALGDYKQRVDESTNALSKLAGIEDDELTRSFTTAFRGSQNVSAALKIQAASADVMRGRHIELSQATIALTKAYGGQTTALRRLGIQVPATLKGLDAIAFVQEKFKGQAAANTTAMDRFNAAFKNTQEIIGLALLPTFNKLLNTASKWLADTRNQQRIGHVANQTVKVTGQVLHAAALGFKAYSVAIKPVIEQMRGLVTIGKQAVDVFNGLKGAVTGLAGHFGIGGGSKPLRPGSSPIGENALGGGGGLAAAATAVVAGVPLGQRPGLRGQFLRAQLALAKAQVTEAKADDRRALVEQARIVRAIIAKTTNLKKRTDLYSQLGSLEEQIRAIDAQTEATRKTTRDKELEARKKEAQNVRDHLAKLRQREAALREKIKQIQEKFTVSLDTARQGIGDLFTGPILNPTDEARRHILGLGKPRSQDVGQLTADVRAQTAEFLRRQRDIAAIQKAAPKGLRGELGKELANVGIGTLDALAKKPGGFIKAFAARERAAASVATVEMKAQLVTLHAEKLALHGLEVSMDGQKVTDKVTQKQQQKRKNNSASRRGRNAGTN